MVSLQDSPFSASSTWNEQIPSGATYTQLAWPRSTGYNYGVNWDAYSPSVYVAQPTDPVVKVSYPAGWGYPGGTVSVHMPAAANGAAGTDGELVVIDGDIAYNFWQFNRTSTTTATAAEFRSGEHRYRRRLGLPIALSKRGNNGRRRQRARGSPRTGSNGHWQHQSCAADRG